jgi:hypothetical protein
MSKTLFQKYLTHEEYNLGYEDDIHAVNAGVNGYVLTKKWNRVSTVAVPNVSAVKLGQPKIGITYIVFNDTSNILKVTTWSNTVGFDAIPGGYVAYYTCVNASGTKWTIRHEQVYNE